MPRKSTSIEDIRPLAEVEKEAILEAFWITGNVREAAEALEVPLKTMYRRLHEYGVPPPEKDRGIGRPTIFRRRKPLTRQK